MSHRPDLVFLLAIALFVTVFLLLGGFVYHYSWTAFQFPLFVGIIVLALCALDAALGGRYTRDAEAETVSLRDTVLTLGWIVAIVPVVFALGYGIGIPAYIATYLLAHGFGWRLSAIVAAGAFLVVYVGFAILLNVPVPLWPGSRW